MPGGNFLNCEARLNRTDPIPCHRCILATLTIPWNWDGTLFLHLNPVWHCVEYMSAWSLLTAGQMIKCCQRPLESWNWSRAEFPPLCWSKVLLAFSQLEVMQCCLLPAWSDASAQLLALQYTQAEPEKLAKKREACKKKEKLAKKRKACQKKKSLPRKREKFAGQS